MAEPTTRALAFASSSASASEPRGAVFEEVRSQNVDETCAQSDRRPPTRPGGIEGNPLVGGAEIAGVHVPADFSGFGLLPFHFGFTENSDSSQKRLERDVLSGKELLREPLRDSPTIHFKRKPLILTRPRILSWRVNFGPDQSINLNNLAWTDRSDSLDLHEPLLAPGDTFTKSLSFLHYAVVPRGKKDLALREFDAGLIHKRVANDSGPRYPAVRNVKVSYHYGVPVIHAFGEELIPYGMTTERIYYRKHLYDFNMEARMERVGGLLVEFVLNAPERTIQRTRLVPSLPDLTPKKILPDGFNFFGSIQTTNPPWLISGMNRVYYALSRMPVAGEHKIRLAMDARGRFKAYLMSPRQHALLFRLSVAADIPCAVFVLETLGIFSRELVRLICDYLESPVERVHEGFSRMDETLPVTS